jgi:putative ATPase
MIIFASEDVGNADPRALEVAVAVSRAVEFVGLPEARINLAQGATYLATAPKSNASYLAIDEALREIETNGALSPPAALRDAHYGGATQLGHGQGYVYAHAQGGYIAQPHLPEGLVDREFYRPTGEGEEGRVREFLVRMRALRRGDPTTIVISEGDVPA